MSKEIKYTDAVPNSIVTRYKDKPTEAAMAVMPNGVFVSNVYDAYEEGRKSVMVKQEPVAWIIETEIHGKLSEWVCTDKKHYMEAHDSIKEPIPLYTAPPKREPLSSIKILELTSKHEYAINLIRAVEKAHGIGGGE